MTVCGPILALRAAVGLLRWMQEGGRLPQASPIREAVCAAAAAAAAAISMGLIAYALLAQPAARLGISAAWEVWAFALTFVLSLLALYAPDPADWKIIFRKPVAESSAVWVALPVAAAVLLLFPPAGSAAWGPRSWLDVLAAHRPSAWWLAERWREWLVGWPCLFVGLCVFHERIEALMRHPALTVKADPRGWLLLAMFAPAGAAGVFAQARMPVAAAVGQTLWSFLLGSALGLGLLGLRHYARRQPPSPRLDP